MTKRLNYIEGLRGIASLIVVFNHLALSFYPAIYSKNILEIHTKNFELFIYNTPFNIFFNGSFAVYLFLMISGFVTTYSFYQNKKSILHLTETIIKRLFRLIIPIIFCNILVFFFIFYNLFTNTQAALITHSNWWLKALWQFSPNLIDALIQAIFGIFYTQINQTYNPVLWAISYLFLGAFLVASILSLVSLLKGKYILYFIVTLLFINSYFLPILVGMFISDFYCNYPSVKIDSKPTMIILLLLAIFFSSYPIMNDSNIIQNSIYARLPHLNMYNSFGLYHTLGSLLLLVIVINSQFSQRILSLKPLLFLGKISYSLYLIHLIIIGSLTSFLFITYYNQHSYSLAVGLATSISLPLIFLTAYILYRFIERPSSEIAQKIYDNLN